MHQPLKKNSLSFLYKVINSIKYNAFFIILSILFPYLFFKMDAGRELFIQLTDTDQWYNNTLIAAAFHLITLSMWCFPALSIPLFMFITRTDSNKKLYYVDQLSIKYFNNDLENKSIGRFWAAISILLFNFTLIWIFVDKWWSILGVIIMIMGMLLLRRYKILDKMKGWIGKPVLFFLVNYEWVFYILMLAYYIIVPLVIQQCSDVVIPFLLLIFHFINMVLIIFHLYILDTTPLKEISKDEKIIKKQSYKADLLRHCIVIGMLFLNIIVLYILMSNVLLPNISPIYVSISIAALLIMLFELFISTQLLLVDIAKDDNLKFRYSIYEFSVIGLAILLFYTYFTKSINDGSIRTERIADASQLPLLSSRDTSLEVHFDRWYSARQSMENAIYKDTDSTHVIYLISGQGGGSRAAAWFFMVMKYLEQFDPLIYEKTYSFSTVSGSITGANMYLASKKFNLFKATDSLASKKFKTLTDLDSIRNSMKENNILHFVKDIYSKNYLSSGIFGLTISDYFIDGIRGKLGNSRRDRNFHFQNEEMESFLQSDAFKQNVVYPVSAVKDHFLGDYLLPYTNYKGMPPPLFLINSTIIETGKKAIFSPIALKDFSMYEDVYFNFRNCSTNDLRALPLITCVNQGQSFPILNTYNLIHGTGRLGDGGLYENSGTETTLEIYEKLISLKILQANNSKIKIVCITILNSPGKSTESKISNNSIFGTLQFAINNPFTGRENIALRRLEKVVNTYGKGSHISIKPTKSYSLTRALSKRTIDSMYIDLINNPTYITEFTNLVKLYSTPKNINPTVGIVVDTLTLTQKNTHREVSKYMTNIFIQTISTLKNNAEIIKTMLSTNHNVYTVEIINDNFDNSVRYFNDSDAAKANAICDLLNQYNNQHKFTTLDLSKTYANIPDGQIEIWIGKP